jgi:methylmalonyl-CoA mutase C-terminal domain/subunit
MAGKSIGNGAKERRIRALFCVSALDGHDRGLKYIAKKFSEAGMEVVYFTYEMTDEVVDAAIQEDVDVIGVSFFTGGHLTMLSDLFEALKAKGADDILVISGGVIPTADIPLLHQLGVKAVFGPGTYAEAAIKCVKENVGDRR